MLNKILTKSRHLNCACIICSQTYYMLPKTIRKMLSNITIFNPRNYAEYEAMSKELLNFNTHDSITLYNYCFKEKYAHVDIDLNTHDLYLNFHKLIITK